MMDRRGFLRMIAMLTAEAGIPWSLAMANSVPSSAEQGPQVLSGLHPPPWNCPALNMLVIGVGGTGAEVVNTMMRQQERAGLSFAVVDSDAAVLIRSKAPNRLQLMRPDTGSKPLSASDVEVLMDDVVRKFGPPEARVSGF